MLVTCVPCPKPSNQRSWSFSRGVPVVAKFAPHTLRRFDEMSKWLVFKPVSMTPIGTEAPPMPENRPVAASCVRSASAPMAGAAASSAASTRPTGSTASTKSAAVSLSKMP